MENSVENTKHNKRKNLVTIILLGGLLLGLAIFAYVKPADEFSVSERRKLKQFPEFSLEKVWGKKQANGKKTPTFMDEFEGYATDQFPMRETFMKTYAAFAYYGLGKKEVNDIYLHNGYAAKVKTQLNSDSLEWSLNRFAYLNENYFTNSRVYLAIIPDKVYYLAKESDYPYLDYEELATTFAEGTKHYASFVDLTEQLSLSNYYRTDTHWKQETLPEVAEYLVGTMKSSNQSVETDLVEGDLNLGSFKLNQATDEFYGVYYGQASLPMKPDEIWYLTNDVMDGYRVTCYDTGKEEQMPLYELEAAEGNDPYELYLSGSKSLVVIENPSVTDQSELVIFRDSFGSSMAPLLAQEYSKVTLVDIRYLNPALVGRFVEFDGADVLFLYSAQLLNNSVGQFN